MYRYCVMQTCCVHWSVMGHLELLKSFTVNIILLGFAKFKAKAWFWAANCVQSSRVAILSLARTADFEWEQERISWNSNWGLCSTWLQRRSPAAELESSNQSRVAARMCVIVTICCDSWTEQTGNKSVFPE